jgi:tRNA pseudouridine38-40 synthase
MRKIKLLLTYDGTEFQGWQRQQNGVATVQGTLEHVLTQIYSEPIRVIGSGRTDAGTHAVGQVAHFEAPKVLQKEERLVRALNSLLPDSIAVKGAWLAPDDFHALASARRKTYIYRIWNHPIRSPLWNKRALWVHHPLDLEFLNSLSEHIVGTRDFKSFQTAGTPVKSTIRTVDVCRWIAKSPHLLEFHIRGNGFLKQMVRNLVGTLLYLERNRQTDDTPVGRLQTIFDARDRQAAKTTVAAHGLYLYRVQYPPALDKKCRKL